MLSPLNVSMEYVQHTKFIVSIIITVSKAVPPHAMEVFTGEDKQNRELHTSSSNLQENTQK
jgi:hypothetical protein